MAPADTDEIAERVRTIIISVLGLTSDDRVTPDALLVEDLNADSLDLLHLAMELEVNFDIKVPDDALGNDTVEGVIELVKELS